jgi:uncharacterized protein DUF3105
MAKSKRKRAGSSSRPSAGRPSGGRPGSRPSTEATPQPVKPAPATPGGPNRVERKEAARKAREAQRRRAARMRLLKRSGTVLGVGGVIAAVLFFTLQSGGKKATAAEQALLDQAAQAKVTAGCGDVQTIAPYDPESLDQTHIGSAGGPQTMPPLSSYPSQPPTSGPHSGSPLGSGVYFSPVPLDQSLHSLEHGAVIVWLSPDADADALTTLQDFFQTDDEQTKVIVSPYDYPEQEGGTLPEGKQMVLVAWHRMQVCDQVSVPVAFDFVAHYRTVPSILDYQGDAPEPGAAIDAPA